MNLTKQYPEKKHYDVAVLSVWFGSNYGSLLNGYAVYKMLKSMNKSVLMVNKIGAKPNDGEINGTLSARFINEFYPEEEISPLYTYEKLKELNDYADTFLVGSDQIFDYYISGFFHNAFLLGFVNDNKRKISYATSFGHMPEKTPLGKIEERKALFKRFNAISVREQSGVNIFRDNYGIKATHTLEPVFCIDRSEFDSIASTSKMDTSEPYILTYILDPTPEKRELIQFYERRSAKKVINILDGQPHTFKENVEKLGLPNCLTGIDAKDFLKLYKDADFVITDSFHGSAFSIIYNKPFISIANARRGYTRFEDLLGRFDLMDRLVYDRDLNSFNKSLDYLDAFDYANVNTKIEIAKKESLSWLKNALNIPIKNDFNAYTNVNTALEIGLCTGCAACAQVCPSKAIQMKPDHDGFLRAVVDDIICTNCGLCEKKCVVLHPKYINNSKPDCQAMMASDDIRKISSSGGMFTVAAEYVLKHGGYVCGAAYNDNFEVSHIIIHDVSDLGKLRGSKYIQSNAGLIYPKIKNLLNQNKTVLFTGLPCQIAGIKAYLGKDYNNLYTIDLLCHGITSHKVFEKYCSDVFQNKKLTRIEFKQKEPWGWHPGINAYFEDGSKYSVPAEKDPYFVAYLHNISKNTACSDCKFSCLPRQGDLTMGDFWRISDFDPSLHDNQGTSVVLLNNSKGHEFYTNLKPYMKISKDAPLQVAISGNQCIEHPYALQKNRFKFFKNLDSVSFSQLTSACDNNKVYEQEYMDIIKDVPKDDLEFYYIAKKAVKHFSGRQIVTWIRSEKFERVLKKYFGLPVAFGVSMRKEALKEDYIKDFEVLKGGSKKFYLISLDRAYDEGIYKKLQDFGYQENEDFIFRKHKPIILENFELSKSNYYDDYGNSLEGFNAIIGKVVFRGFNNHINVGKYFITGKNVSFDLGANAFIDIKDNTRFNASSRIEVLGYNKIASLKIGANCTFFSGALFRFYNDEKPVSAQIGDHCTSSSKFDLHANQGKKIIIGRDCMFSFETDLWAGDGHTIFDVRTGKNRNAASDTFSPQNQLVIGDHVWVGKQAFLMHGTNIGSGCVVGARSVVKGIFPNNCAIAGNPAVKVKEDVAWSREGVSNNIASCGSPDYARLTSPANAPISGRRVLVIGGTRFMGIQLVKELVALGNDVTIATRGKTKDGFGMAVSRLTLDVSDQESCKTALQGKYFDVVFDNLAYCSKFANNVLANVKCGKYIQLSSVEAYANMAIDMKEERFDPYRLPLEICDQTVGYVKGKRQAEAIVYQNYKHVDAVTIRIPYVTKTDRLYYYCRSIVKQIPMNIDDTSRGFTFIRDTEVGKFLPWIAAQNYTGPINLASEGLVTIQMILNYIQTKVGKQPVINTESGAESPFHVFNEKTFSLNMDTAKRLGYKASNINDWFWKLMDEYIARALKE